MLITLMIGSFQTYTFEMDELCLACHESSLRLMVILAIGLSYNSSYSI